MAWTTALSPAKVNLFLESGARRADGYHDIDTVMVKVDLFDRLAFRRRGDDQVRLHVRCSSAGETLSSGADNLVLRAVSLLEEYCRQKFGLDILLEKRIPMQAGLGGGSSNATTTLVALNRMMKLGLSREALSSLAARLGSDQVFFLCRSAARCTGRGEHMQVLGGFQKLNMVIGVPPVGLDTGSVFREFDRRAGETSSSSPMRHGSLFARDWGRLPVPALASRMFNRLQGAASSLTPWIDELGREFQRTGGLGCMMTGSGSGFYALYRHRSQARAACRQLASRLRSVRFFVSATIDAPVLFPATSA